MAVLQDRDGNSIPLSPARQAGGIIFVPGQMALRDGKVAGQTIEEQSEIVIDNIVDRLALFGRSLKDVVKVTVWITDAADFGRFNAVYMKRFAEPLPARTAVVSALLMPDALVEMEAVAAG